jgi:hypothetical protein
MPASLGKCKGANAKHLDKLESTASKIVANSIGQDFIKFLERTKQR